MSSPAGPISQMMPHNFSLISVFVKMRQPPTLHPKHVSPSVTTYFHFKKLLITLTEVSVYFSVSKLLYLTTTLH